MSKVAKFPSARAWKSGIPIDIDSERRLLVETLEEFRASLELGSSALPKRIREILHVVHTHLFDENLSLFMIKEAIGINNNNITTEFRRAMGIGLGQYILSTCIKAGVWLLARTPAPAYLIARAVCYEEESFSRAVRRTYGCTPVQYRRKAAQGGDELDRRGAVGTGRSGGSARKETDEENRLRRTVKKKC